VVVVDLICLANSKKWGGWCVAGLRADGGGWMRPVNARADHGQLWRSQIALPNGTFPRPLDLLRIPLREAKPAPTQPENWTISPGRWMLLRRPVSQTLHCILHSAIAKGPDLLANRTDRISEKYFEEHPGTPSLALIAPETLQWRIGEDVKGKPQLRACFRWRGARYSLAVTDVELERRMRDLPNGLHPFRAAGLPPTSRIYLLISLGEPLEGVCYKLVAGVIAI
jgi:hypothetical protein